MIGIFITGFLLFKKKFYPNGKKIIPFDIHQLLKDDHELLKITNYTIAPCIKMTEYEATQCILTSYILTLYLRRNHLESSPFWPIFKPDK